MWSYCYSSSEKNIATRKRNMKQQNKTTEKESEDKKWTPADRQVRVI